MVKKKKIRVVRSGQVSVTKDMIFAVRDELKSDILSLKHGNKSMKLDIGSLRLEFKSLRGEFKSLKLDMSSLREDFKRFEADISSQVHKITLLVEEQNARNVIVLDGLSILSHRQTQIEKNMVELQEVVLRAKG